MTATLHIDSQLRDALDQPLDADLISTRSGGGSAKFKYVRGDITAHKLNEHFGPLGWGSEAPIAEVISTTITKKQERNGQDVEVEFHVVIARADVTLTIKPITAESTQTVFREPGIGYGEVEVGKSQKDAYAMAIKGASTDGLKRCADRLGRQFGLLLTNDGKQDPANYAGATQGGNSTNSRQSNSGGSYSSRGSSRGSSNSSSRGGNRSNSSDRRSPQDGERDDSRSTGRGHSGNDDRGHDMSSTRTDSPSNANEGRDNSGRSSPPRDSQGKSEGPRDSESGAPASSDNSTGQANTNYNLEQVPVTLQDMCDFCATMVARLKEFRQLRDKEQLLSQHRNTIDRLDPKARRLLMTRLNEIGIQFDAVTG